MRATTSNYGLNIKLSAKELSVIEPTGKELSVTLAVSTAGLIELSPATKHGRNRKLQPGRDGAYLQIAQASFSRRLVEGKSGELIALAESAPGRLLFCVPTEWFTDAVTSDNGALSARAGRRARAVGMPNLRELTEAVETLNHAVLAGATVRREKGKIIVVATVEI